MVKSAAITGMLFLCIIIALAVPGRTYEEIAGKLTQEIEQTYFYYLPDGYDPGKSYPLAVCLHDYGDSPEQFASRMFRSTGDIACIFLFPSAPWPVDVDKRNPGSGWNTRFWGDSPAYDVAYQLVLGFNLIDDSVKKIQSQMQIDPDNVYLIGEGQGGGYALQLAAGQYSSYAGYCSINFPYASDYHWQTIAANDLPLLILNTVPGFTIPTPGADATQIFGIYKFADAAYRTYARESTVATPEEFEDLREWLLLHTYVKESIPLAPILDDIANPDKGITAKCAALAMLPHSGWNGDYEAVHDALHNVITDQATDSEVLLYAIYAVGAMRVSGMEDDLEAVVQSAELPNGRREPSPFEVGSEKYDEKNYGWAFPITVLDDAMLARLRSNGTRVAALRALRKINTARALEVLDEVKTAVIAGKGVVNGMDAIIPPYTGDIILSLEGHDVASVESYLEIVREYSLYDQITAKVIRGGKVRTIKFENTFPASYLEEYVLP